MSQELDTAKQQIKQLQEEVERLQGELKAIQTSTSWRLTAVFRHPLSRLVHFKRTAHLMGYRVAERGGWIRMTLDAFASLGAHGLEPFRNAMVYLRSNGHVEPAIGSLGHDREDYGFWRTQRHVDYADVVSQLPPVSNEFPLISVVIPTYKPPLDLFKKALQSIIDQDYPRWEICIADDASGDQVLLEFLTALGSTEPRIKFTSREQNGHISACSNSALALATGDYVLLLDQDDIVPPHALRLVADAIVRSPGCRILFSDEDRMSADASEHFGPYFKPEFNYDLFLGQNMVSHLGVYHRKTLQDIGGFRVGMEGSQDYDLALRVLETCTGQEVVHLPYVLYHWRAIKGSTALSNSEKSYASSAGLRAVENHLARKGVTAEVVPHKELRFFNQVRYPLPEERPPVTVVIALKEANPHLTDLIGRIARTAGRVSPKFVVLSPSVDASRLSSISGITVDVRSQAPNAQAAVALFREAGNSGFFCFVNALFVEFSENWLEELIRFAAQDRVGLVAARIRNGLGQLDHGGILMLAENRAVFAHQGLEKGDPGNAGRAALTQSFTSVSPALVALRLRDGIADRLDPDLPWPHSLIDLGFGLHADGMDNIWTPAAEARFEHPAYAGKRNLFNDPGLSARARRHWIGKWRTRITERNYNPNLSPEGDFSLNWKRAIALNGPDSSAWK